MYSQIFLTTSPRANLPDPTTAASSADGCRGCWRAFGFLTSSAMILLPRDRMAPAAYPQRAFGVSTLCERPRKRRFGARHGLNWAALPRSRNPHARRRSDAAAGVFARE